MKWGAAGCVVVLVVAVVLALAGGWTDMATMERCYDLPDDEDVLKVTSETNKRRELVPVLVSAAN